MGTQKNCLNEMVLLSPHNICYKIDGQDIFHNFTPIFLILTDLKSSQIVLICSVVIAHWKMIFTPKKYGYQIL